MMGRQEATDNERVGEPDRSLLNLENSVRGGEAEVSPEGRSPKAGAGWDLTQEGIEGLRAVWASTEPAMFAAKLVENGVAAEVLADANVLSRQDAIRTAIAAKQLEPQLDIGLMGLLPATPVAQWTAEESDRAGRILAIVAEISDGTRILAALNRVMRSPVTAVKSKAILLLVRATQNAELAQQWQNAADDRVRANAVEGLWNCEGPEALAFFRSMVNDPHHRVRANAVVGLHLLNDPEAPTLLQDMLEHGSPTYRKAAIWAMGFLGDPRYLPQLNALRNDTQAEIHGCAIRAMARIRRSMRADEGASPARHKG